MNTKTPCTDHNGITYESIKDMCDAYGVTPTLYLKRIERGWSVKEALEGKQPYFSRDGKDYYSQKEVCKAFDIVDRKSYRVTDHLGNKYANEAEMCAFYDVKVSTYRSRRRKGMSMKDALTK